jgi:hypothetical protein
MHCQQGGEVLHALGTWECLEGVPIGSGNFWAVWCRAGHMGRSNRPQAVRWVVGGLTAWGWRSNRRGQSEQVFSLCCIPMLQCCICLGGVCFGSGELAYVQGELFVVFEIRFGGLRFLLELCFVSDVSSRCPCLRGPRLVFFKWSCTLLFFGFRSLVEVSFYLFFSFPFSLVTNQVWGQCTHQGGDW